MAATPPYLYSSPVGPQNFFFSDMLRSIVQNRNAEQAARSASNQANHNSVSGGHPQGRRSRKRAWGNARTHTDTTTLGKESKLHGLGGKLPAEKPLELTNKCHSPIIKFGKSSSELHTESLKGLALKHSLAEYAQTQQLNNNNSIHAPQTDPQSQTPSTVTTASSDLVLPPPPPMWYPPLYPPYGIDPLHFFIDLRVSGHIYDRKKENTSPNATTDDTITTAKPRHGSAFSVPTSRRDNKSPNSRALNLTSTSPTISGSTSDKHQSTTFNHNIYDHHTTPFDKESSPTLTTKNTNYVLQNLPRIYTDLSPSSQIGAPEERNSPVHSDETTTDSKSELDAGQEDDGRRREMMAMHRRDSVDREDEDSNDVVIVDSKHSNNN